MYFHYSFLILPLVFDGLSVSIIFSKYSNQKNKKSRKENTLRLLAFADKPQFGGESGIRTLGPFRDTAFRVLHLRPLGQLSKAIPCQHLQTAIIIIIRTYQKKSIGYFKKEKRDWKNQSLLQWWTLTDLNC